MRTSARAADFSAAASSGSGFARSVHPADTLLAAAKAKSSQVTGVAFASSSCSFSCSDHRALRGGFLPLGVEGCLVTQRGGC